MNDSKNYEDIPIVFAWEAIPYYALYCLKCLKECGVRIKVISTNKSPVKAQAEAILGDSILWVDSKGSIAWIHELGFVPNCVFLTGWANPAFNSLLRIVKQHHGKVVCMVDNYKKNTFKQKIGRFILPFILKKYDAFLVPGKATIKYLNSFGIEKSKIFTGLYGADDKIFNKKIPIAERKEKLIFIGQLNERKGVRTLISAFEKFSLNFPSWNLEIYGRGSLKYLLEKRKKVYLHDFSVPEVLAKALNESRFFVLPSLEDHWGVVVHEASLCGCGLILSNRVGAAEDLFTQGNGFLFEAGDENDLVNQLTKMAGLNNNELHKISEKSLFLAREFGPKIFTQSVKAILSSILL